MRPQNLKGSYTGAVLFLSVAREEQPGKDQYQESVTLGGFD
jgi:hypothetical protein